MTTSSNTTSYRMHKVTSYRYLYLLYYDQPKMTFLTLKSYILYAYFWSKGVGYLKSATADGWLRLLPHFVQSAKYQSLFLTMSSLAYAEVEVSEPEFTVLNPTRDEIINISWSNVNFSVGTKRILTDCWGNVSTHLYAYVDPALYLCC